MRNKLSVLPQMDLSDWIILKQNISLKTLNISEMMSLCKSEEFQKEHIKQMKSNVEHVMQTLDLIHVALTDMELELRSLENLQLQIKLGDHESL